MDYFKNINYLYIEIVYFAKYNNNCDSIITKKTIKKDRQFAGKGIHYCNICDSAMYQGKKIAVVGDGNCALEEAIFLTRFAEKVYLNKKI